VLGLRHWYEFKARYAKMGGFARLQKRRQADGSWKPERVPVQIVDWVNLDDLWRRLAPHYLRRLKKDCIDIPDKIPPVALSVALRPETWRLYRGMRDEALAFLEGGAVTAQQAGVKALRLAQLTSGFLGGVRSTDDEGNPYGDPETREVGREKLDALLSLCSGWLESEPNVKAALWFRFRAEADRAARELALLPGVTVAPLVGAQKRDDRDRAAGLLDPRSAPPGPAFVVGTEQTGAFGLNQAAADRVLHSSSGFSHVIRTQSDDRPHRPGQVRRVSYFDLVAEGPDGQRTVDHAVVRALRKKEDLAAWGAREWAKALREE